MICNPVKKSKDDDMIKSDYCRQLDTTSQIMMIYILIHYLMLFKAVKIATMSHDKHDIFAFSILKSSETF